MFFFLYNIQIIDNFGDLFAMSLKKIIIKKYNKNDRNYR